MKLLIPLLLTSSLVGALVAPASGVTAADQPTPVAATAAASTADEAIALLKRLPDPLALAQLNDYLASASSEDAGRVLMQIAIAAARPARPAVVTMLSHRDPQVVDRALRALTAIGWSATSTREQVERLLSDGSPTIAALAAGCLGSGDDLRAVPALIARLQKPPAEVAAASLSALQRLSGVDFKSDVEAWRAWYLAYRSEASHRLATQATGLSDEEPAKQIAAIQALAGMRGERQEAVDLVEPLAKSPDASVAMAARQALATLAPSEYTMPSAAEVVAVASPAVVVEAKPAGGVMNYLASKGLFDTWYGIALTIFTGILLLSGVLFLLRTSPVKNATRRFGRVVVAGTVRFVRPLTTRIRKGTGRIVRSFTQSAKTEEKKTG